MFRQRIGPHVALMAVVKANAYGHGAEEVAKRALSSGADLLGVAVAEEGRDLRRVGISCPILILGASNREQIAMALDHELDITLCDNNAWHQVVELSTTMKVKARIHLKVDTGMGRLGVSPDRVVETWVPKLCHPMIEWQGLMSHFAESDAEDVDYTKEQLRRFLDVIEELRCHQATPPMIHVANSAAAMRFPGSHFNMVRIGIGLYGAETYDVKYPLKAAMTMESRITFIKEVGPDIPIGYGRTFVTSENTVIATVAVGYADGYRRALSNRSHVLIGGTRCPVVGRVSMDQITVAVPKTLSLQVGDVVTLMGESETGAAITVHEMASWADTISYEILTGITSRVPRVYSESSG